MKAGKIILLGFLLLSRLPFIKSQYVYTQLGENLTFDKEAPQVRQKINLGEEFRFSKQYSIWGWFRYLDGDQPSIMNVLNLHNDQEIANNSAIIGPFPNPAFPDCPYTSEQIKNIPNIGRSPEVANNPNCSPQKIDSLDIYFDTLSTKKQDLLYLNFDLVPATDGQFTFNVTFLFQNGETPGLSDMKILGFNEIPWLGEHWGFFAISFNYSTDQGAMYFKIFDDSFNNSQNKTFQLNYRDFLLQKNSTITIASVENNNYFEQVAGFTGNISYIEMSSYFTTQLSTLWSGYMQSSAFGYKGVLLNLDFDLYEANKIVTSTGSLDESYQIKGNAQSLYSIDRNKLGARFYDKSSLNLGEIDLKTPDLLKAIVFYFKISYKEDLPDDFTLVQRGRIGENGYIRISLIRKQEGRSILLSVKGDDSSQTFVWESPSIIPQDYQTTFLAGIAIAPSGAGRRVYADQFDRTNFELIDDKLNFDPSPKTITLLENSNPQTFQGYLDLFNFKILNSASSAEFLHQINNAAEPSKFTFFDDCQFRSSYYRNAYECFDCKSKVLTKEDLCFAYCSKNYKNPMEQVCKPCLEANCNEIEKTTWIVERLEPTVYRFKPTRTLDSGFTNLDKDIKIKFENEGQQNSIYNYEISNKTINQQEQYIDYDFTFKDTIVDKKIQFQIDEDVQNPQYDLNRNLIFHNDSSIVKEINLNTVKEGICYLSDNKERALKALGITAMTVFFASVLVLVLISLFCFNRIYNLGALWKFLLHNWMKIQLIAFFLFLAIYMPCCIQEFLHWIYKLAVSWNHNLGGAIDNANDDNANYVNGMADSRPPRQFYNEGIEAFYLHNFGIFFIVQGFIFFIYIILKIWDCFVTQSANCFYRLFVFLEFTGLIVLFLLTAMQTFVFSALNWRLAKFSHSYFVMCFLITIGYILVFIAFWAYSLMKLISGGYVFMDPLVQDKYYYFFSGYKRGKWCKTWDHWMVMSHFIIGMMIGLLYYNQLSQMIIITAVLLVLFGVTILLRPWRYAIFTIVEILCQLLILVGVILFLMIAIYDTSGCLTCGKRESVTCWFIVIFFFLAIILGALGLIAQSLKSLLGEEEEYDKYEFNEEQEQNVAVYTSQGQQGFQQNVQNIYNEEVNIKNQEQLVENVQQKNMQDFMKGIQMDRDESYMSRSQNYSYSQPDIPGRAPHELAPDSEDEQYNIPSIVRALTANNSFNSDQLEDSRLELDQQENLLKMKKQKFYESNNRYSYDNSMFNDNIDQYRLNNLTSNKYITEEHVIKNTKISKNSLISDKNTFQ